MKRALHAVKAVIAENWTPVRIVELEERARKAMSWKSQRRFARELGMSHSYLRWLECGERPITDEVVHLCEMMERRITGEIKERGVTIIADFEVPVKIQIFANRRWKPL